MLRALGQASTADVARSMGRSSEALHYHMRALLDAGLITEAFKRPAPKKPETVYEALGTRVRLPKVDRSPELAALTRKTVAAGLRHVMRGYLQAGEAAAKDPSLRSQMHIVRANVRLKPQDMEEFVALIEKASQFATERRSEDGDRVMWSSVVFPLVKIK